MARRTVILLAVGLLAVASLLLAPLERMMPAGLDFAPVTFRFLAIVNPMILTIAAVFLGAWAAPRAGLHAPLIDAWSSGGKAGQVVRHAALPVLACGLAAAAIVILYGIVAARWFPPTAGFPMPLATKLLYGGVGEEILLRWGVMSLLARIALKVMPRGKAMPVAAFLSALLFAVGHLPALYGVVPNPAVPLVVAVLVGNAAAGLLFGLLYWRRGLEAAMAAHMIAHIGSTAVVVFVNG